MGKYLFQFTSFVTNLKFVNRHVYRAASSLDWAPDKSLMQAVEPHIYCMHERNVLLFQLNDGVPNAQHNVKI